MITKSGQLLGGLNEQQQNAVTTTKGPLLVLAGAGTGKTKTITHRAAYLVKNNVAARNILAVTFTKKAATEMQQRMVGLVGPQAEEMSISTFHSLGYRIMREQQHKLPYGNKLAVIPEPERRKLIQSILEAPEHTDAGQYFDGHRLQSQIARLKNIGFALGVDSADRRTSLVDDCVWPLFDAYQEALRKRSQLDFDDLLCVPLLLLRNDRALRAHYAARFPYLMIDEYQDTNTVQYELMQQIIGPEQNLAVVGDDDQSIYAFRGADVSRIRNFTSDFPTAVVVRLEANYRSVRPILTLAQRVIEPARNRLPKVLVSQRGSGTPVHFHVHQDEAEEASFIIETIRAMTTGNRSLSDIAVLYRNRRDAVPIRTALRAAGVPTSGDGVSLMTLHQAKGLEFAIVFLIAVEDHALPSYHAIKAGGQAVEEERRLLYVGITRAEDQLILTSAKRRGSWARSLSRFLPLASPDVGYHVLAN